MHLQHKDQLHLLGKRKRGRKPGSTISTLNSLLHSAAVDLAAQTKSATVEEYGRRDESQYRQEPPKYGNQDANNHGHETRINRDEAENEQAPFTAETRETKPLKDCVGRQGGEQQQFINPFSDLAMASYNQL